MGSRNAATSNCSQVPPPPPLNVIPALADPGPQAERRGEEGALSRGRFERARRSAVSGTPPKDTGGLPRRRGACLPPSLSASLSVIAHAFGMSAGL